MDRLRRPMEGRLLDRSIDAIRRPCAVMRKDFLPTSSSAVVAIPPGDQHGQESGGRDSIPHCWPIVHPERGGAEVVRGGSFFSTFLCFLDPRDFLRQLF